MKKEYIECGLVRTAHGVRGLVKVEAWCDSPDVLASAKRIFLETAPGVFEERGVLSASLMSGLVLMGIEGITTREDAFAMKNITLYLHRDDIPVKPGDMLLQDMIGLKVIDADTDKLYGYLKDVNDGAAGRIYTVKTESGDVLLPAVAEFVKEIDEERGIMITPIPGFFD
ncbi:MAG: 16S rRNA processing protein RimM [Clostridia bacterium]|nr:16S rRNA processing protein RimM [Clostridia bacterium]